MCKNDKYVQMKFRVTNLSEMALNNFTLAHGVDPDPDYENFELWGTVNDVIEDGHLAVAHGNYSGKMIAYGLCDSYRQRVGFTNWDVAANPQLYDPNGDLDDITVHCVTRFNVIQGYQSRVFKFYVLFDEKLSRDKIEDIYNKAIKSCCCCCDLTNEISLPDGPPSGGHGPKSEDEIALIEVIKLRILAGESHQELKEFFPLLAHPDNVKAEQRKKK